MPDMQPTCRQHFFFLCHPVQETEEYPRRQPVIIKKILNKNIIIKEKIPTLRQVNWLGSRIQSRPRYPVWVNTHDGFGGTGWMPGIIDKVIDHGDGLYKIVLQNLEDRANDGGKMWCDLEGVVHDFTEEKKHYQKEIDLRKLKEEQRSKIDNSKKDYYRYEDVSI